MEPPKPTVLGLLTQLHQSTQSLQRQRIFSYSKEIITKTGNRSAHSGFNTPPLGTSADFYAADVLNSALKNVHVTCSSWWSWVQYLSKAHIFRKWTKIMLLWVSYLWNKGEATVRICKIVGWSSLSSQEMDAQEVCVYLLKTRCKWSQLDSSMRTLLVPTVVGFFSCFLLFAILSTPHQVE